MNLVVILCRTPEIQHTFLHIKSLCIKEGCKTFNVKMLETVMSLIHGCTDGISDVEIDIILNLSRQKLNLVAFSGEIR